MNPSEDKVADRPELPDLIGAVLDGSAEPEQYARLDRWLANDVAARTLYRRCVNLHAALRVYGSSAGAASSAPPAILSPKARARRRWRPALVAAVVLMALGTLWAWSVRPGHAAVAVLVGLEGDVRVVSRSGELVRPSLGQRLLPNQEIRTIGAGSQAIVERADGSRVVIGSDSAALFSVPLGPEVPAGAWQITLQAGQLQAVGDHGNSRPPLLVRTPHARIRAESASTVITASSDSTQVELSGGGAEVTRHWDGQTSLVPPNTLATVPAQGSETVVQKLGTRVTQPRQCLRHPCRTVNALAWSPDGKLLATGGSDGVTRLWDMARGEIRSALTGLDVGVAALAFSPDGQRVAAMDRNNAFLAWSVADGRARHRLPAATGHPQVVFAPDSRSVFVSSYRQGPRQPQSVKSWDLETGAELAAFPERTRSLEGFAVAPDGSLLATGSFEGTVRLWDLKTGQMRETLPSTGGGAIVALAFAPDSHTLVWAGKDRVHLWDVARWELREGSRVPGGDIVALAYAPNGRQLITAQGRYVICREASTGQPLTAYCCGDPASTAVAISPDGATLATASFDSSVRLWDLPR